MLKDQKDLLSPFNKHGVFGAPIREFAPEDFRDHHNVIFQFGVPLNRIDPLQSIGSLQFQDAWQRRVIPRVDDDLSVPFVPAGDLIENKLETAPLQDLADAEQLQKLKKVR